MLITPTIGSSAAIPRLRTRIRQAPWVCDLLSHTGTQGQMGPDLAFMPSFHVLKFLIILNKWPCVLLHWVPPVIQLILRTDPKERKICPPFQKQNKHESVGLAMKGHLKRFKSCIHKQIFCNVSLVLTYPKFCAPLGTPATSSGDKNSNLEGEFHI